MYEIFSHLQPAQLLSVSRTNKTLRDALMRKSARWIWRASFRNDEDIPPVPADLNEPQYARLLFDKSCMYCPSRYGVNVAWAARVRCCGKCLEEKFMEHDELKSDDDVRRALEVCVPSYEHKTYGTIYVIDQVESFFDACNILPDDDDELVLAWLRERRRQCEVQSEHGLQLEKMVKRDLRRQRREAIYQKLRDSGWGEELQKLEHDLRDHPLVRKTQRLTQKGWKKIESELNMFVTERNRVRLKLQKADIIRRRYYLLADVYDEFLASQPRDAVFPPIGSIVSLENLRTSLENTPVDQCQLSRDFYLQLIKEIPPASLAKWREQADAALIDLLRPTRPGQATTVDHLRLASTLFVIVLEYEARGTVKTYPDLLADDSVTDYFVNVSGPATGKERAFFPWSARRLAVADTGFAQIARGLLTLMGMDPDTATHDEVQLRDPWFFVEGKEVLQALRWPNVVAYARDRLSSGDKIFLASEEEAAWCRWELANSEWSLAETHESNATIPRTITVFCAHCSATFNGYDVGSHLSSLHGKDVVTFRDIVPRRGSGMLPNGLAFPRREFVHEAMFTIPDAPPVSGTEL
ncbi:hypothetical protein BD626DRAFT_521802 [Schizophyllum amplum]|uniref:F-box domain-containing protein n=1 Tax=Schizophyllum amplum TaxID=97359 RepID=A0A550BTJ7_9AGAR|nr:hypothetical protein BD626DRAFT_521802 [Auriculariopsis ampla]